MSLGTEIFTGKLDEIKAQLNEINDKLITLKLLEERFATSKDTIERVFVRIEKIELKVETLELAQPLAHLTQKWLFALVAFAFTGVGAIIVLALKRVFLV